MAGINKYFYKGFILNLLLIKMKSIFEHMDISETIYEIVVEL